MTTCTSSLLSFLPATFFCAASIQYTHTHAFMAASPTNTATNTASNTDSHTDTPTHTQTQTHTQTHTHAHTHIRTPAFIGASPTPFHSLSCYQ